MEAKRHYNRTSRNHQERAESTTRTAADDLAFEDLKTRLPALVAEIEARRQAAEAQATENESKEF